MIKYKVGDRVQIDKYYYEKKVAGKTGTIVKTYEKTKTYEQDFVLINLGKELGKKQISKSYLRKVWW